MRTATAAVHLGADPYRDNPSTNCLLAHERGVLVNVFGARAARAVTHLHVGRAQCAYAADVLVALLAMA